MATPRTSSGDRTIRARTRHRAFGRSVVAGSIMALAALTLTSGAVTARIAGPSAPSLPSDSPAVTPSASRPSTAPSNTTLAPASVIGARILITNDDGVQPGQESDGLFELRKALCAAGADVAVVGPWLDRSGSSASITYGSSDTRFTLTEPVIGAGYDDCGDTPSSGAVWGACVTLAAAPGACDDDTPSLTPADAATLGATAAVQELLGWTDGPDLVISGINRGGNDGLNVNVSGTVGAATIASSLGFPAIAISASSSGDALANHQAAAAWATGFVGTLVANDLLPTDHILNVNYPRTDRDPITDAVWTDVAQLSPFATGFARDGLHFESMFAFCTSGPRCGDPEEGSDSAVYGGGAISISAVSVDRTAGALADADAVRSLVEAGVFSPVPPPPPEPTEGYTALVPARLLDTRQPGGTTIDNTFAATGKLTANTEIQLQITGRHGIPDNAAAAVLNITVNDPDDAGYITVYPCGQPRPDASNLNYTAGQTIPNNTITQLGDNGTICIYTDQTTNLIADIGGYLPADSDYTALVPARFLDTRQPGGTTIDNTFAATGKLTANTEIQLQITGRHGIPDNAAAAVLNITVNDPDDAGYITVYPCGQPRPDASNLNYTAGQTIPNNTITQLGDNGTICIYTDQTTNLIADIGGYLPADSDYTALVPARFLDTRQPGGTTIDNTFAATGKLTANTEIQLQITGRHGIPDNAAAAVLNITVNDPDDAGYITVYPCGQPRPDASNLNYTAGQTIPNNTITQLGDNGTICIYTDQTTNLIADIGGVFGGSDGGD